MMKNLKKSRSVRGWKKMERLMTFDAATGVRIYKKKEGVFGVDIPGTHWRMIFSNHDGEFICLAKTDEVDSLYKIENGTVIPC